jgi:hypothetical protein
MSSYVGSSGYSGQPQSLVWHYQIDLDSTLFNRWFVDIFEQGVLRYTPNAACIGTANLIIDKGTTLVIEEKTAITNGERKIAKLDMVDDFDDIDVTGMNGTYNLIVSWENIADDTRGVDFLLLSNAELGDEYTSLGYNYVQLGQVVVAGGIINDNNATNQTVASMSSGLDGWSGYSGDKGDEGISGWSGTSGISGWSGEAGTPGESGYSGVSGWSGESGYSGEAEIGDSGTSGVSGWSGTSGRSGWSGTSGRSGYSGTSGWSGASVSASAWPIHSVFFSDVATNPNTLLGFGTWTQISQGRFIMGQTTGYSGLQKGGASTINIRHDHTVTPSTATTHKHSVSITSNGPSTTAGGFVGGAGSQAAGESHTHLVSGNTGSGGSHTHSATVGDSLSTAQSIIPPYTVLYIWLRTA